MSNYYSEQEFFRSLPLVNFLLSLLIVFHHGFTTNVDFNGSFLPSSYGITVTIERYMYNLSECAVPVFYFISAYLFYRTFDGSWLQYKKKMNRRLYSLLIPYVIFCTLGYVKAGIFNGTWGGHLGLLESICKCDTMPLWFIRELVVLSLLAPVIYWLKKRPIISFVLSLAIIMFVVMGCVPYRCFIYWMPVYLMGAMMTSDKWGKVGRIMDEKKWKIIACSSLYIYMIWAWFLPNGMKEISWNLNLEMMLFRIVTPVVAVPMVSLLSKQQLEDRLFMHYSFFVYCMHAPVITLLTLAYSKTVTRLIDVEIVQYLAVIVSTYFFCVLLAMMLQRYTPWLWSVLNGKR